jgi:hypothetical protein
MLKKPYLVKESEKLKEKARKALKACLATISGIEDLKTITAPEDSRNADITATFTLNGKRWTLLADAFNNGQFREAHIAANRLEGYLEGRPGAYGVMIAPFIPEQVDEVCREKGIGTVDLSGNCRLSFGSVNIHFKGNKNKFPRRTFLSTLYAPKATRILRVLLSKPSENWKMIPLAEKADVSLAQVAHVKKLLDDRHWISQTKDGIRLTQPKELLQEWAEHYQFRTTNRTEGYYSLKEEGEILDQIGAQSLGVHILGSGHVCALTAFAGAHYVFPYVRNWTISLFVDDMEFWASILNLKKVDTGPKVILAEPYDEGVFFDGQTIDKKPIVSNIQLYLDLKTIGGRGEDAAEALFNEVIEKKW